MFTVVAYLSILCTACKVLFKDPSHPKFIYISVTPEHRKYANFPQIHIVQMVAFIKTVKRKQAI